MACLSPRKAWRAIMPNPSGKFSLVFSRKKGLKSTAMRVPCGQCIGCRLEKSRQWALRCQKEADLYDENCVVTLTYDDAHLPANGSIQLEDVQLFMKRLREHFSGTRIRSFGCAEYGEKRGRPHYHIVLFNLDFSDKVEDLEMDQDEFKYYQSKVLTEIWGMGKTQIMDCNFETTAYVARYVTKKINGPGHTRIKLDLKTGRFVPVADERSVAVSRRPGIGKAWYDANKQHVFNQDTVFERGMAMRPPKFFDRHMELDDPEAFAKLKKKRKEARQKIDCKVNREIQNGNLTNAFDRGFKSRDKANLVVASAAASLLKRGIDQ